MMLDIFNAKPEKNVTNYPYLYITYLQIEFMLKYLENKFDVQALNGKPGELQRL